jgi:hypothetical protein
MIGQRWFWPAFLLLAALTAYGVASENLFTHSVWTPVGFQRFRWFVLAYCAWAALGGLLFPRLFPWITAGAALFYATSVAGPRAVAAVVLYLVSCWAIGSFAAPGLLGMVAGLAAWTWLIGFAVFAPVNYPWVYAIAMAIPLLARMRHIRLPAAVPGAASFFPAALLCGVLLMHLLVALKPEASTDALAMHLAIPAAIENHHQFPFDFRHTVWALMPMNADWSYTAVHLTGGEAATRMFNFAMLLTVAAFTWKLSGPWMTALLASSPIVHLVTGSLFVENYWAAMAAAAFTGIVRFRETGERRYALASAALLGACLATKYGSFFFVLPAALLLAMELRRQSQWRLAPAMLLLAAVLGAPPYARSWLASGNPVYPFFNHVFRSPHFDSEHPFIDSRFRKPLTPTLLYDLTFHTSGYYEGQNGGWGFQYLLLLPLAVLLLRRDTPYVAWSSAAVAIPYVVLTFSGQSNVRYLYPALPLLHVFAGGVFRAVSKPPRIALTAAAALFVLLNAYFLPASGWTHGDFDIFQEDMAPVRALTAYLNRQHPGEPVAYLETTQAGGLRGRTYTNSWHHAAFNDRLAETASGPEAARLMQQLGIRYIVAPADLKTLPQPTTRTMLDAYAEPEFEHAGWKVYGLRSDPQGRPLSILHAGEYDDMDPLLEYEGRWAGDRQFAEPANHSVTYSAHPGASVRIRFQGNSVTYVYTMAVNRGQAAVILDGRQHTVNQHSATTRWRQSATFEATGSGVHTFEIRVSGQPPGNFVDLDQLIIR